MYYVAFISKRRLFHDRNWLASNKELWVVYTHFSILSEEDMKIPVIFTAKIHKIDKVNCCSAHKKHCNYFAACQMLQVSKFTLALIRSILLTQ